MLVGNILVIQGAKLGDMVCTTPVFREIKKNYPEVRLLVAGDSVNEKVLLGNPYIDKYVLINDLSIKYLRSLDLNTAIILNPNPLILLKLIFSRIPQIVAPDVIGGFSPYVTKIYRFLLTFVIRVKHRMHYYAPQEYLNALVPLGITSNNTSKDLFVDSSVLEHMEERLKISKGRLKVVIAPTAGNKVKEWPSSKFGVLANYLVKKHEAFIIIIGGSSDINTNKEVEAVLPADSVLNTTGTSIEELKAIIKQADLFVSADTGPIYIAEAFGVPTVDIVGPVDEREQPPIGDKHLVVIPPFRLKPELFVMNARVYDKEEARRLACSTEVDDVVSAIEMLINKA